jgi:hypothetical protein
MSGTETFGPAAEITMMMSVEAAMAAAASTPMSRVSPGEPDGVGPVPWSPASSFCLFPANPPAC